MLSLFLFFSFLFSVVVWWVPVLCFYEMDIFAVGFVSEGKPTQTQTQTQRKKREEGIYREGERVVAWGLRKSERGRR